MKKSNTRGCLILIFVNSYYFFVLRGDRIISNPVIFIFAVLYIFAESAIAYSNDMFS